MMTLKKAIYAGLRPHRTLKYLLKWDADCVLHNGMCFAKVQSANITGLVHWLHSTASTPNGQTSDGIPGEGMAFIVARQRCQRFRAKAADGGWLESLFRYSGDSPFILDNHAHGS